jgi:hypothetical protein
MGCAISSTEAMGIVVTGQTASSFMKKEEGRIFHPIRITEKEVNKQTEMKKGGEPIKIQAKIEFRPIRGQQAMNARKSLRC